MTSRPEQDAAISRIEAAAAERELVEAALLYTMPVPDYADEWCASCSTGRYARAALRRAADKYRRLQAQITNE